MNITLLHGDCRTLLPGVPDGSVDAVVTDPPYEYGFMGRAWDRSGIAYNVALWQEVLRVLKPGGHVLAFGGSRTYHRLACAIEDAGFEIRDSLAWIYGSGYPKSLAVDKAIDKAAGATREVVGHKKLNPRDKKTYIPTEGGGYHGMHSSPVAGMQITAPATDLAAQWAGWGTALKPAHENIVLARKPLIGTVAANVQAYGTGALNIDACRVGTDTLVYRSRGAKGLVDQHFAQGDRPYTQGLPTRDEPVTVAEGRWPPNLILSHAPECNGVCSPDCAIAELDRQSGERPMSGRHGESGSGKPAGMFGIGSTRQQTYFDTGGASRYFPTFRYVAKASRAERNRGCAGLPEATPTTYHDESVDGAASRGRQPRHSTPTTNHHNTVKPVKLIEWLCTLITPPGGRILDPFMGSGTTGIAAVHLGFGFIGIEKEDDYFPICQARIAAAEAAYQPALLEVT